ncbi:hypothetical protein Q4Q52_05685 [Shewanella sp. SP1S2-4]|uniref:hypothetical protein n=1 Tax=Shewanella sp. SP1S2-4 TaxID=3063537 RepID=UPI00288E93F2|nr:hypothetical protein [Shewanella sp. SP1S2-4]MDT3319258.1 hypothetical protein [Shewanella sp. SP1S2-4]
MTTNPTARQKDQSSLVEQSRMLADWHFRLVCFVALLALLLIGLYFLNFHSGVPDQEKFGQFGDYLGGVLNPILGFATVILLVHSLKIQSKELSLTRDELARSSDAMQRQVNHLEQEAKLNELMRVITDIRAQFRTQITSKVKITDDFFHIFWQAHKHKFSESKQVYELTIYNLLYEDSTSSIQDIEEAKVYIKNLYEYSLKQKQQCSWSNIETLLVNFSIVAKKYYSSSENKETAMIYLNEAKSMLQPFQNIFWTEDIAKQLAIINIELAETNNHLQK